MPLNDWLGGIFPNRLTTPEQKLIKLDCTGETQKLLLDYCQSYGFDVTKTFGGNDIAPEAFKFHVTILASENLAQFSNGSRPIPEIETTARHFQILGVDRDFPTIRLNLTEPIAVIREFYEVVEQLRPTFQDYAPHITLSYNWFGTPDLDLIPLPDFPIVFDKLIIQKF